MTEYGYGATYSSTTANPAFNDIKTIFERDLENISQISGAPKGSIRCRAIDGKSKDGKHRMSVEAFSLAVASGLTLCTANLVGMPISCSKSKLQIEVTILDSNNNVIGRYISDFHKSKSYVAMYWGYSLSQAPRKDARYVFTACMEDIKYQIEKDYTRLTEALK